MEADHPGEILVGSLPFAGPPDVKPPAPAPHEGKVVRQHDQAERHHPETENRQEAKNTAEDQRAANGDAQRRDCGSRIRHVPMTSSCVRASMPNFLVFRCSAIKFHLSNIWHARLPDIPGVAQVWRCGNQRCISPFTWGVVHNPTRLCVFFEKPLGKSEKHLY
jgi:hypothetical protein